MTSETRVELCPDQSMRITFRMSPREYKAMIDFMARHRMTNVSAFIRMARRGWMAETKVAGNRSIWTLTKEMGV